MNIEQRVTELVEDKIADRPDLFLVEVKMHPNGKLMILMDGDQASGGSPKRAACSGANP